VNLANDTNPVRITDLTFGDGQQALLATRMRTENLEGIAPEMGRAGFWSARSGEELRLTS